MKKKLFLGIAAVLSAAVLCIGLVACGPGSAADITGDEVTKEEWEAAFAEDSFKNVKLALKIVMEGKEDGDFGKMTTEGAITVADGKEHVKMTAKFEGSAIEKDEDGKEIKEDSQELFVDATGTTPVYYMKNDEGEWETTPGGLTLGSVLSMFTMYEGLYESFEYSAEQKGYVMKEDLGMFSTNSFVLKFKDSKLAAIYMENSDEDEESGDYSKMVYDFVFTYGGQSVTFPVDLPKDEE